MLRFIEYMDVGHTNGWRMDEVVPAAELVARISAEFPLRAYDRARTRKNPELGLPPALSGALTKLVPLAATRSRTTKFAIGVPRPLAKS